MTIGAAILAVAPRAAGAQAALDRLSVHGFLSQAFGMSQRNQVIGIPEQGTFDYRTAALQFRFAATDDDHVVVQFSHERFGRSPDVPGDAELEVDWAWYEHRFGPATSVRLGKIAIPFGIYNEVRDVGTLLPFYRAPNVMYNERVFTIETVNGIVVSHTFADGSPWSLTVDGYFGGWDYPQPDGTEAHASNAVGGRVWLNSRSRVCGSAATYSAIQQPTSSSRRRTTPTGRGGGSRRSTPIYTG